MADSQVIVTRAFRRLQAIDITEQPSAAEMTHGLALLSEMINGWGAKGINSAPQAVTADVVSGSDRIRNVLPDTGELLIGVSVSGTGIPADATIRAVLTDTSFQLSTEATADAAATTLTFDFLPVPVKYEGAVVALLAVRLSEDLGLPVSAKLQMDSAEGWADILAGYLPDRKAQFDRALAAPAGIWDASTGLLT